MSANSDPIAGNWYQDPDTGEKFEVVAVDEDAGTVEIRYVDGGSDELDLDTWYAQGPEPIDAPEDWSESLDDLEQDDLDADEWPQPRGRSSRWDDDEDDDDVWVGEDDEEIPWWEDQ